jgi:hypothetical protein
MPRLRNAVTVVAAGLALSVLGAGTAAATPSDCTPPPAPECPSMECGGGLGIGGGLDLSGVLGGLLGGLVGGGGCCPDD